MTQPQFSIVIPCYNDGAYILDAIHSVEHQTETSWEILVVDDGSTDRETQNILKELERREKLRLFHAPHKGPASARNIGIANSTGQFILPLDADDKLHETYLEKAATFFAKAPALSIFYTRARFFGMIDATWSLPAFDIKNFAIENCVYASAVFPKSMWQKIGGYSENMRSGLEDYDFWLRAVYHGYIPQRLDEELFFYRVKKNSRTVHLLRGANETEMHQKLIENNQAFFAQPIILQELYLQLKTSQRELHQIRRSITWRIFGKYLFKCEFWLRSLKARILGRGDFF